LHERLIAKHPDKPKGQAFSIKEVLKIARAVFSGDNDFLYQEPSPRRNESDRVQERRTECSMRDQQETERDRRTSRRRQARETSFEGQESEDEEASSSDQEQQSSQGHRHSSPRVETKTVRFKDNQRNNKELEDMIGRLYDLSVREKSYAILFAQCAQHFPEAMFGVPKPEYRTGSPAIAYSYQPAAPQPPTSQPWSAPTTAPAPTPPAPAASTGTAASFFRFGPHPKACAFCRAENH